MKTVQFFPLTILCVFCLQWKANAQLQPTTLLDQYAATPKALEQTRYGNLPVDLNSGTFSMDIPIGTYSDQDFTIPISLHYVAAGFRPGSPSGEAGLGWSLIAGGSITREIVGLDDFDPDGGFKAAPSFSKDTVYTLNHSVSVINGVPSLDGSHETTSDIYHFTFPGHSGSFIIDNGGNFVAYATSGERGTYDISYNSMDGYFTITTSDGTAWRFGSISTNRELLLRQNGILDTVPQELDNGDMPVVTWLLDKITAPNGRQAVFSYSSNRQNYYSIPSEGNDIITTFGRGFNGNLHKFASLIYTSYLSCISIREPSNMVKEVAAFNWELKNYKEISGTENFNYTKMIVCTRRLTSVSLKEGNTTLRTATLTYDDTKGRPLLTSVAIPVYGTWSMQYFLPSGNGQLPGQLTNAVDFWGFYNGNNSNADNLVCPTTVSSESYNESLNTYAMDPDGDYSVLGMLKKVTWPTGGSTSIIYEANHAYNMILRRRYPYYTPIPQPDDRSATNAFLTYIVPYSVMLHSDECGGVRVAEITDDSITDGSFTREFSYVDSSGKSTGIIQEFNRYFGGRVGNNDIYNPYLKYPNNGLNQRHIAYSSVTETFYDGSAVQTDFSSWTDYPDTFSTNNIVYNSDPPAFGEIYDLFIDNILREGNSMAYRRGHPIRQVTRNPGGAIIKEETFTYEDQSDDYAAYVLGSGHFWWSAKRFLSDWVLSSVTTVEHPSPGMNLTTITSYTYDTYGRRTISSITDSDGSMRTVTDTYHTGTVRPSLVTNTQYSIKPSGSSTTYNTEATAYTYSQSGNLWNLTSETRTLYNASGTGTTADQIAYSAYDATGHPRQITVNGESSAIVWGYAGRYPLATVRNCEWSGLPSALQGTLSAGLTDAQKASLYAMTGKEVHAYTYFPSVGVSQEIGPSGRSLSYMYDINYRLAEVRDAGSTFLMEYNYGTTSYSATTNLRYVETVTNVDGSTSRSERVIHDGLGQEWMHLIGKSGSLNTTEMAVLTRHDGLGRTTRSYLPYAANSISLSGAYSAQSSYWSNQISTEGPYAFASYSYTGGPLALLTKEMAPGKAISNANKSTDITRSINVAGEVPSITLNPTNGSVTVSGYHPAGTLLKTTTTYPDGETVVTFETALGTPVLSRTTDGTEQYDTYTVMDRWDRTAWVLTPLLGAQIRQAAAGAGVTFTRGGTEAASSCYVYEYDSRGNVSRIRRPGASSESFGYDTAHRVTSNTPPALQNAGSMYVAYEYDNLGRKVSATLMRTPEIPFLNRSSDGGVDTSPDAEDERQRAIVDETLHTLSSYTYAQSSSVDCITGETPGTPYSPVPSDLAFASRTGIVTSADFHVTGELLTENHYPLMTPVDPYDASTGIIGWKPGDGMVGDTPARTAYYYDGKGRVVQAVTGWPDGGLTRLSCSYDLEGNVLTELEEHRPSGAQASETDWKLTQNSYDARRNLLASFVYVGRGSSPSSASASVSFSTLYTYSGVGRLTGKTISSSNHTLSSSIASTLQGWMSSQTIALDNVQTFRQDLKYWDPDRTSIVKRYGGDISETTSVHAGYTSRSEGYAYDGFGRLSGTSSFSGTSTSAGTVNVEDGITYDAAGNILTMSRKGVGGTTTDNMSMTYTGSRLTSVTDSGTSWTNQYAADGSLKKDGRTGIYYADNLLGFVAQLAEEDAMSVSGYSATASYVYLADGTKYKAQTSGGNAVLYRGSFTYSQSGNTISLESVSVPEGRVFVSGSTWTPYAYVTDHRGDVREIVDLGAGTVVERNDYYSYGTRITKPYSSATDFPQLSANRWRLSGKEEQVTVAGIGSLDFGARHYDPFVARWLSPDPLMEMYYKHSPYAYCAGNPISLIDPNGCMVGDYYNLFGKYIGTDGIQDGKKYLVLDNKEARAIMKTNRAKGTTSKSEVMSSVLVPSDAIVTKMEEAYVATENDGNEHGFRAGQRGYITSLAVGTPKEVNMTGPMNELILVGEYAIIDVHTHPMGTPDNHSEAKPSDIDKEGALTFGENVVLGYIWDVNNQSPNTIGGQPSFTPVRALSYYNQNGPIGEPIIFAKYRKAVRRINRITR